jgi:hypothetical protein
VTEQLAFWIASNSEEEGVPFRTLPMPDMVEYCFFGYLYLTLFIYLLTIPYLHPDTLLYKLESLEIGNMFWNGPSSRMSGLP